MGRFIRRKSSRMRVAALAALLLLGGAATLQAAQDDPRLPTYFDQLVGAPDPISAYTIERQIWQIWYEHENGEIETLLRDGDVAMNSGDFPTALADFNAVIEQDPDFAEGWNRRATLRFLMGDYEGSIADIDETLVREPHHFGALAGLGLVNMELGEDEQALDAFERALVVHPQFAGPRANAKYLRKKIEDGQI
ncbi:MAG: tetratricopeptide repeat protein [Rhodospirillaceae bacterium]|nr:tetratricopeptide repeat protein [Rhodospirillaceae bacterium]